MSCVRSWQTMFCHRPGKMLVFYTAVFCCSTSKAKEMINKIIMKGQGLPDSIGMSDGHVMEEVMIPGSKVGLVIGKGGENIKMLQVTMALSSTSTCSIYSF